MGYDFERIGIRIKKENIIDLISSNATWTSDPAIVVRELLQNSVEACRYRKSRSSPNYQPQIKVSFNHMDLTIEIWDNGCGMSRHIILDNFLTVGNSRSFDPTYSTSDYSSLARFGIGFWSVFTIAELAIISTAPFEYQSGNMDQKATGVEFEVSIKEFKDYTVFRPKEQLPGTSIKLYLKNKVNLNDIIHKINYHIGASEIPILIEDDKGNSIVIPERIEFPSKEIIFAGKAGLLPQFNFEEFNYASIVDDIDIKIRLYYLKDTASSLHFVHPITKMSALHLQDRGISQRFRGTGVCGFLFNSLPQTPLLVLNRVGLMISNALNPKGYKFTLNRMGLMDSPEYKRFKEIVTDEIHNCYRNFLRQNKAFDAQTISRLNQQSRLHGGENHGSYTGSQLKTLLDAECSDLIAFKLYKIQKGKSVDNCEVLYFFYKDLIQQAFQLWLPEPPLAVNNRTALQFPGYAYVLLKARLDLSQENYLLERTHEADMLADNASNIEVDTTHVVGSSVTPFIFRRFFSNDIDPNNAKAFELASIRGTWTGSIVERPIKGSNFARLSQYHFVVKPNSLIATDLRRLISEGQTWKAAELVSRLGDFQAWVQDPTFQKYFLDNADGTSFNALIEVGP